MASVDSIFEKSDISESKKKSQMLFGRLLISLRKQGAIKLYSLLGSVSDTDLIKDNLILFIKDKTSYEMLNNPHDLQELNNALLNIESGYSIEFRSLEETHLDEYKFVEFLKEEFGKILTIK